MSDTKENLLEDPVKKIIIVVKKDNTEKIKRRRGYKDSEKKEVVMTESEEKKKKLNIVIRKKISLAKSRTRKEEKTLSEIGESRTYLKSKIIKKKVYLAGIRYKQKEEENKKLKEEEEKKQKEEEEKQLQEKKVRREKVRKDHHRLQKLIETVTARKRARDEVQIQQKEETEKKRNVEKYPANIAGIIALLYFVKPEKIEQIKITNVQKFLNEHFPYIDNTSHNKAIINERKKISRAINSLFNGSSSMVRYTSSRTYYRDYKEKKVEIRRGNS